MHDVEGDFLVVGSEGGQPKQTKRAGRWARVHVTAHRIFRYQKEENSIRASISDQIQPGMAQIRGLNAHDRPPESIRQRYKKYQKTPLAEIDLDSSILDLQALDPDQLPEPVSVSQWRSSEDLRLAFDQFVQGDNKAWQHRGPLLENIPVFTHRSVSGQHDVNLVLLDEYKERIEKSLRIRVSNEWQAC